MSVRDEKALFGNQWLPKVIVGVFLCLPSAWAGEGPNFITYTHQMEEPGNLEIDTKAVISKPDGGSRFLGSAMEFEYGTTGWWTTEFYLDGQATAKGRQEKEREIETKLILGSYVKGWTVAENFIVEKNIKHEPWEFGYAFAISRPFALRARPDACIFCAENFQAGVEVYGGLGTHKDFGLTDTSHYVAPTIAWQLPDGPLFRFSPGFGVTAQSLPVLFRFSVSYEVAQAGRAIREMFAGDKGKR